MKRLLLTGLLLTVVLFGAAIARGEISGSGKLLVKFGGGFAPRSLPRDRDVPVTVHLDTSIKTADGSTPPQLRRISFEVNRYGHITTRGLPVCRSAELESTSSTEALARCRGSLVGHGSFGANVAFPNREPFPVHGEMLAFNGSANGRPAILLHVYASTPADVTVVLAFTVRHPKQGKFGTVLSAKVPRLAADLGYVSDVALVFDRRYSYRGKRYSFLSARCAAPLGYPGAIFSFTRGTFEFAEGRKIVTTLARNCVVR
jgi:hypothetical protein